MSENSNTEQQKSDAEKLIGSQLQQGAKVTNVLMPNQQQAVIEYVSEAYIPSEMADRYPLLSMIIKKRPIGNEKPIDEWILNMEYSLIGILEKMGYDDLAERESLGHIYMREGFRASDGFERKAQVIQRSITEETLTTVNKSAKPGILSRIGNLASGGGKQ